jgi:hypothetical protein
VKNQPPQATTSDGPVPEGLIPEGLVPEAVAAPVARPWARPLVVVPALAACALVGALFPSFSKRSTFAVLLFGGALIWLGSSGRLPRRPVPRRLSGTAAWWLVPTLFLAIVELVNFLFGSTYPHPTLSVLLDPVLARYPARAAVYFGWLAGLWGLVRR